MAKGHKHGSMDIADHERMFGAFVKWISWAAVIIIATLILLAIING